MKAVIVLLLLVASAYSIGCYTPLGVACSTTQVSGWTWCPWIGVWVEIPCDGIATIMTQGKTLVCRSGQLQTSDCIAQRGEQAPEELAERTTFATCPITGSLSTVCCNSPKTCHTGSTVAAVCY